ncbi:unnamed protein product [Orchesella dallaii]|uniref:Ig-like domain-containing protein n=1 Tax=Orchesella dallaii TaxID=48710 RepID=A0ABP1QSY1_9HEXA
MHNMAATSKPIWKLVASLLFMCSTCSFAEGVILSGVQNGIVGNYEWFTCTFTADRKEETEWMYKFKNGNSMPVEESDMLKPFETVDWNSTTKVLSITSLILLKSSEIEKISCRHSQEFLNLEIQDLTTVTADEDPCLKAKASGRDGKPVTVVQTISPALLSPYRKSHYMSGHTLKVIYPTEVSQVRLTCLSYGVPPAWSIKEDDLPKLKFASWSQAQSSLGSDCKQQVLEIYDVKGSSGDEVKFPLECRSESGSTPLELTFKFADDATTRNNPNFTATENCINQVVDQFWNKELTGVGVASSFVIILMMAGMAIMKKQLNQQQNENRELQNKPSNSGTGSSADGAGPSPAPVDVRIE